MAQDGSEMAQHGPKMAQHGPKMAPSWPQDGAKLAPGSPKMAPKLHIKYIKKQNVCLCIRVLAVLPAHVVAGGGLIKTLLRTDKNL